MDKNLDTLKNSDIVIIKIGENVVEKTAIDSNFITYYDKLIIYFKNYFLHNYF